MKTMKKLFSALLAVALTLTLVPAIGAKAAPNEVFAVTDGGAFESEKLPENSYSVGWQFASDFDLTEIIGMEAGMVDGAGNEIITYTANETQVAAQLERGSINKENKTTSVPFYNTLANGLEDWDWTVAHGSAFAEWNPAKLWVEVTTNSGTYQDFIAIDTVEQNPAEQSITVTDAGEFPGWDGAYNLGWQYSDNFDLDSITYIAVGMTDKKGTPIVTYYAAEEQLAYQRENGYMTADRMSSAPFYKVDQKGNELKEGYDLDWTVFFEEGFEAWNPATLWVTVGTADKEYFDWYDIDPCYHENAVFVPAKEPTCEEEGHIAYWYCEECDSDFLNEELTEYGDWYRDIWVNCLGHDAEKVEAKEPTADKDGNIEHIRCKRCGKLFATDQTPLTEKDVILKATGAKDENKDNAGTPQTGDSSNAAVWALLALAALATVGVSTYRKNLANSN